MWTYWSFDTKRAFPAQLASGIDRETFADVQEPPLRATNFQTMGDSKGPTGISRRDLLKLSAMTSVGLLVGRTAVALDETTTSSPSFRVDIPDLREAAANVVAISMDPLVIGSAQDDVPVTVDALGGPGTARWGDAHLTFVMPDGERNPGLREWFDLTEAGTPRRKNISITLFAPTGGTLGLYVLVDAYPVEWSAGTFDYRPALQTETLVLRPARIDERSSERR